MVARADIGSPARNVRGFTLLELLTAIGVGGILLAIAVPAMRTFVQTDQLMTETNTLLLAMYAARGEAIKADTGVTVCASTDGATCNSANWAQGFIVVNTAPGSTPILTTNALTNGSTITEANNQTAITFLSTGQSSAAANYAFTLCDARGAGSARYLQVAPTGRAVESTTPGRNLAGAGLTCP
jgi:type IV fimbrial biogenesis protein FimT